MKHIKTSSVYKKSKAQIVQTITYRNNNGAIKNKTIVHNYVYHQSK